MKAPLRRIGAVLAGFLTIVLVSTATDMVLHATGVFPPIGQSMSNAMFLLATAYRIVYGVLGCYVAACLAPDRPMQHAIALGLLGVVVSIIGTVVTWGKPEFGPAWYPLTLVAISLPSAWLGGWLALRRQPAAGPTM